MKGLLAEFDSAKTCERAISELKNRRLKKLDVFMPYPEKSIQKALGVKKSPLPWLVFAAGLTGAVFAYWVQWATNVADYPINVGGRPDHAVPAFIPITFETTILFAGTAAFVAGLILAGLPRFYHPLFEVEGFERVSSDGWFIAIDAADPHFMYLEHKDLLLELGAQNVTELGAAAESDEEEQES